MQSKKTLFSTRDLVIVGVFSALAYVLMLLESPGYLGFLRIEFSDVPAILGGLGLGPAAGVFIELIKNIIKALSTKTIGAGELANFVVGSAYVLPLHYLQKVEGKTPPADGICGWDGDNVCCRYDCQLFCHIAAVFQYVRRSGRADRICGKHDTGISSGN